jgi:valyl-tRNA synthetase
MTLLSYSPQQKRIALSIKRIEGYRNFANKLWNASRYALMNLSGTHAKATGVRPAPKALVNRWILSRLARAVAAADRGLEDYRVDDATSAMYHFVWDELCDWYVELTKPLLDEGADPAVAEETRQTLVHTLEATLRALHPMMPFITEEIWQRVPKGDLGESIMVAPYPVGDVDGAIDVIAEQEVGILQTTIVGVRTIRAEHQVAWAKRVRVHVFAEDDASRAVIARQTALIARLTNANVAAVPSAAELEELTGPRDATFYDAGIKVVVPDVIDVDKEKERLGRELKKVDKDLEQSTKKLANASFVERAPADKVAAERAQNTALAAKKSALEEALSRLEG